MTGLKKGGDWKGELRPSQLSLPAALGWRDKQGLLHFPDKTCSLICSSFNHPQPTVSLYSSLLSPKGRTFFLK